MNTTLENRSASPLRAVAFGLVLGTLSVMLWQSLVANERAQLQREIAGQTEVLTTKLGQIVEQRILAMDRMAKRWETRRGIPQKDWQVDAHNFIQHQPGYQAIEWVDRTFQVQWIVPSKGNEAAQDLNLAFEERRRIALEAARDRREITVTRTIDLVQGGKGFLVYAPLYPEDQFDGFILGVFRVQELVDQILPQKVTEGYSLTLYDGEEKIYHRTSSSNASDAAWAQEAEVNLRDTKWRFQILPTPEMLDAAQSRLPVIALSVGLLLAGILTYSIFLEKMARLRSQHLGNANERLQLEVSERKRAQERIAQSEKELSDFFDNAAIGLHWVAPDGVILRANQCELDMLGYSREEYVSHHVAEFHVDQDVIQDILDRLSSGETLNNYPARLRSKDGSVKHVLINSNVYRENGIFTHIRCFTRDDTDRHRAEQLREEQLATAEFGLAIGEALRRSDCINEMLRGCCEAMVQHLDAAFGRIWTLGEGQQVLELKASEGLYTHLDGPHARVPVGKFKIGLIAQEAKAHLTNDVQHDARVSDKEWARSEAMIAFAGHPLIVDGQVVGVMAMFSRRTLGNATINALAVAADSIAVAIRRYLTERKLLDSDARMRAILDSAVDAIVTIDMRGQVDSFNPAAERMFGYQSQEVLGNNVNMLMPSPYKSEHDSYLANYLRTRQKKIIGIGREVTGLRKDGSTFPLELTISEIRQSDLRLFTGIMRDISERKEAEQALAEATCLLQRQASTDSLTNLANRAGFYETIEEEWKRHQRSGTSLSVALLDVDCFKNYNDSLGHLAGDDCLRDIGRAIKASLYRPGDFAARYGGEEFAVLLPATDDVGAASVCEAICQTIRELAIPHPNSVARDIVTVSTGYMTVIPSDDVTIRDFLQEADIALYHAKEVGRDCVVSRNDYANLLVR